MVDRIENFLFLLTAPLAVKTIAPAYGAYGVAPAYGAYPYGAAYHGAAYAGKLKVLKFREKKTILKLIKFLSQPQSLRLSPTTQLLLATPTLTRSLPHTQLTTHLWPLTTLQLPPRS